MLPSKTTDAPISNDLREHSAELLNASLSKNTMRAYKADWSDFTDWCGRKERNPLAASPETVCAYLADMERDGFRVSTIQRRISSIAKAHELANQDAPTRHPMVTALMSGISKTRAEGHGQGAIPVTSSRVLAMATCCDGSTLAGKRDRALLLLLFASAMRRSEMASLQVADLDFSDPRGLVITIRKSKTDQTGVGREVSITRGEPGSCPVRAVELWLQGAELAEGPLWRGVTRWGQLRGTAMTPAGMAGAVKKAAKAAGFDPEEVSLHGFRAGHVSARRVAGDDVAAIMDTTGHKSVEMVMRYDRASKRFRHNATSALGL